jgi:hypothetical protein
MPTQTKLVDHEAAGPLGYGHLQRFHLGAESKQLRYLTIRPSLGNVVRTCGCDHAIER